MAPPGDRDGEPSGSASDLGSDSTVAQGDSGKTGAGAGASATAALHDADLAAGEPVGEYVIAAKIGEGGFGTVFRAVHPVIDKEVAIKVLKRKYSSDREIVARFVAEARAVNQIGHRNIVDIFAFGRLPDGRQYYVMTFLRGESLHERLAREPGNRLTADAARPILAAIAEALDAAHAAGFAHRDLKPANVFLGDEGDVKLLDFGVAKLFTDEGGHQTETGAPIGTPNYMSPEQARGQRVDHRTDVYSFGVLGYQVLTGRLPFEGGSVIDVALQHVQDEPRPPSSRLPGLAPELDRALLWMLEKQPEARPQSAQAAMRALDTAMGHPPDDGPLVAPTTARRRERLLPAADDTAARAASAALATPPRTRPLTLVAAGVVGTLALVAIGWRLTRQPSDPPRRVRAAPVVAPDAAPAEPTADAAPPRTPVVTLVLAIEPRTAEVRLDGELLHGRSHELRRDEVPHTLVVSAPGYLPLTRTLELADAGPTLIFDVTLAPDVAPVPPRDHRRGREPTPPRRAPAETAPGTGSGSAGGTAADGGRRDPARGIRIDEL